MNKFTPGPWLLRFIKEWPWKTCIMSVSGEVISTRDWPNYSSEDRSLDDAINCLHFKFDQREACAAENRKALANETLKAAAPELLEALESVLSGATSYQLRENEQCVIDARAAIAKATGEP